MSIKWNNQSVDVDLAWGNVNTWRVKKLGIGTPNVKS